MLSASSPRTTRRIKIPATTGLLHAPSLDSQHVNLDPLAPFRLDGKVAIVTGASSGLGARFARVLDAAGASVVLVARRRERLEELASELHDAMAVPCDLARLDVSSVVEVTLARYGRVDVLVNNAG